MKGISEALFKQLIFDVVAEHMTTMPEEAANRLLDLINHYTTQPQWHVVADEDLPKKIIDEYGIPVEYIVMIAGAEEPTTAVMDEDGEWYDVAFEYYNIPESEKDYFNVVAWRELPEPWKGARACI